MQLTVSKNVNKQLTFFQIKLDMATWLLEGHEGDLEKSWKMRNQSGSKYGEVN